MDEYKYKIEYENKLDEILNTIEEVLGDGFIISAKYTHQQAREILSYRMGQIDALLRVKTPIPDIVKVLGICESLVQNMSEKLYKRIDSNNEEIDPALVRKFKKRNIVIK